MTRLDRYDRTCRRWGVIFAVLGAAIALGSIAALYVIEDHKITKTRAPVSALVKTFDI